MDLTTGLGYLGAATCWGLYLSSVPQVLADRAKGRLSCDPLPFPCAFANAVLWCVFGVVVNDASLFAANAPGILAGVLNVCTALRFGPESKMATVEAIFAAGFVGVLLSLLSASSLVFADPETRRLACGYIGTVYLIGMFGSPGVGAVAALRSGDASSISKPLVTAQAFNSAVWVSYGFLRAEPFVLYPNVFGFLLALFTLGVKVFTPAAPPREAESENHEKLQVGDQITMRSISTSLPVSLNETDDWLGCPLMTTANGSNLEVMPSGKEGCITLSAGGRFLQVVEKPMSMTDSFAPSRYIVRAVTCLEPGEAGHFSPIYGQATETDMTNAKTTIAVHHYGEANVAFYNPLHNVFLRINERGEMDCSQEIMPQSAGEAVPSIPAGYEWERFVVETTARRRATGRSAPNLRSDPALSLNQMA